MTAYAKMIWFMFCTLFINFLGSVDVELFVVINFFIAFYMIFKAVNPWFDFSFQVWWANFIMSRYSISRAFSLRFLLLMLGFYKESMACISDIVCVFEFDNKVVHHSKKRKSLLNTLVLMMCSEICLFWQNEVDFADNLFFYIEVVAKE